MGSVLVLGFTGGYGAAVAEELLARGRSVRALVRNVEKARRRTVAQHQNLEIMEGDVQDAQRVHAAAEGCDTIIHSINYPYDQWFPNMAQATQNVVDTAERSGATIVFPGNVYGLKPAYDVPLEESHPNDPTSRKGALRVALEDSLKQSAEKGRIRVLLVRANDYFGPTVRNGLVDPIFGAAVKMKAMDALGNLDIPHEMVYVPDVARATADLLELEGRPAWDVVHVAGYVEPTHRSFLERVAKEAGAPAKIRRVPGFVLAVVGLFNGVVRELREMQYLFDNTLLLSDAKLRSLVPGFAYTHIEDALQATLTSYRDDEPA